MFVFVFEKTTAAASFSFLLRERASCSDKRQHQGVINGRLDIRSCQRLNVSATALEEMEYIINLVISILAGRYTGVNAGRIKV